ncbi:MAG: Ryanodine receptor Ryr, partial [Bacteroidales bacterium]|nr:Ryanodine receptor Ryr [Bacteroidales bacterium]
MDVPYIPQPVEVNKVKLPADVMEITELLAKNTHEVWAQQRLAEGWTYGKERNDER